MPPCGTTRVPQCCRRMTATREKSAVQTAVTELAAREQPAVPARVELAGRGAVRQVVRGEMAVAAQGVPAALEVPEEPGAGLPVGPVAVEREALVVPEAARPVVKDEMAVAALGVRAASVEEVRAAPEERPVVKEHLLVVALEEPVVGLPEAPVGPVAAEMVALAAPEAVRQVVRGQMVVAAQGAPGEQGAREQAEPVARVVAPAGMRFAVDETGNQQFANRTNNSNGRLSVPFDSRARPTNWSWKSWSSSLRGAPVNRSGSPSSSTTFLWQLPPDPTTRIRRERSAPFPSRRFARPLVDLQLHETAGL
jgi:hypothetical protein